MEAPASTTSCSGMPTTSGSAIAMELPPNHPTTKLSLRPKYNGGPNPDKGIVNEIENPNPASGTNNWYAEDGYGNSFNAGFPPPYSPAPVSGGGSYSECANTTQPGVAPIVTYLRSLRHQSELRTRPLLPVEQLQPSGWFRQWEEHAYIDQNPGNTPFTIPPSSTPSIGDDLQLPSYFLEILRRSVEQLCADPSPVQLCEPMGRMPMNNATFATHSSTTRPSCRIRRRSKST